MNSRKQLEKDIIDLVIKNKTLSTVDLTYFLINKYNENEINSVTDDLIKEKKLSTTPSRGQLLIYVGQEEKRPKTETEKYLESKSDK